jgi:hypothetical protein
MLKISRISIIIILTAVIIIYIAPQFKKLFVERAFSPMIRYSSVLKDFIIADFNDGAEKRYYDTKNNSYSRVEYQKMLPMTYYRDLLVWKALPETINGKKIIPQEIEKSLQYSLIRSSFFNSPSIDLYPLYESASIFSKIEEPGSMFRIGSSGMEFINSENNKIEKEISQEFTKALKEKGFVFPSSGCYGNVDPRKPFDEGYFIVDSEQKIFHLKMVKGKPFVRDTKIRPDTKVRYIKFEENPRKEYYGIMITNNNDFYLVTYDNYKTVKLPFKVENIDDIYFLMVCDMLKRTIIIETGSKIRCIATDLDYKVIDTYEMEPKRIDAKASLYSDIVFPLKIKTSASGSGYVVFDFDFSYKGIYLAFASIVIFALFLRLRNYRFYDHIADFIILGITGFSGLAAVFAVGAYKNGNGIAKETAGKEKKI